MFSSYSNAHQKPNYHYKAMCVYQLMEAVGVENVVGVSLYLCMSYTVQEQPSCGLRISAVSKRGNKK